MKTLRALAALLSYPTRELVDALPEIRDVIVSGGVESMTRAPFVVSRTAARTCDTKARQPRRTPSSCANGISSALPPENPTTSHGIGLGGASISTRAPTNIA